MIADVLRGTAALLELAAAGLDTVADIIDPPDSLHPLRGVTEVPGGRWAVTR